MRINAAPMSDPMVGRDGALTSTWHQFFNRVVKTLNVSRPWEIASYTVSSVPPASENEGALVFITNEAGGKTVAFSDGVNWRRVQDRAIIS